MDDLQACWEGLADEVLSETGCDDPPVSPYVLAECLGLEVRPALGSHGARVGDILYVPVRPRAVRQAGVCAHEIAHALLDMYGEDNTEAAACYLASALLLPRRPFERDLHATSWDLKALQNRHVYASAEMIARRIVTLRDAVTTIFDRGRLKARVVSPRLPESYYRLSRFEAELADAVLDTGEAQRPDSLVWAVPVFTPGWRRVIVVADGEQLAGYL